MVWSIALGLIFGVFYSIVSTTTSLVAMRGGHRRFFAIVMGGMLFRMLVAVCIVVAVLLWTQVEWFPFLFSFMGVLFLGLALKILWMHRRKRHA